MTGAVSEQDKQGLGEALAGVLGARVRLLQLEIPGSISSGIISTAEAADAASGNGGGSGGLGNQSRQQQSPYEVGTPPPYVILSSSSSSSFLTPPSPAPEGAKVAEPSAEAHSRPQRPSLPSWETKTIGSSSSSMPGAGAGAWAGGRASPAPAITLPWPKEVVLWYGGVTLVLAPETIGPATAVKGAPKAKTTATHWVLLTDAALYVIETRKAGGAADGKDEKQKGGAASKRAAGVATKVTESDSLCRLERDRVWSLSLPLETRALPNGDEVAVRSTAVVVRLRLAREAAGAGGGEVGAPSTGVAALGRPSGSIDR
ncbi:unnamed protein product [Pylaiella littoralis]